MHRAYNTHEGDEKCIKIVVERLCNCVLWNFADIFEEHSWASTRLHEVVSQIAVLLYCTEYFKYHSDTASGK
jgi:hypothetical protein